MDAAEGVETATGLASAESPPGVLLPTTPKEGATSAVGCAVVLFRVIFEVPEEARVATAAGFSAVAATTS